MSSDLPLQQFASSVEMAKALVTYIDCPERVQSSVREVFGAGIALDTIRGYRARHLAYLGREPERIDRALRYDPIAERDALDEPNRRFLAALETERRISRIWAV